MSRAAEALMSHDVAAEVERDRGPSVNFERVLNEGRTEQQCNTIAEAISAALVRLDRAINTNERTAALLAFIQDYEHSQRPTPLRAFRHRHDLAEPEEAKEIAQW